MPRYSYRGNPEFISAVEGRLEKAGFSSEGEVELADFVLTFCTSMTALEDLYFGDGGLVQLMKAGTVAIDFSACTPNFAKELSAVCTVHDIIMVEAPAVVKNKLAEEAFARGNMACYAGSEGDGVKAASDVLEVVFGDVQVLGDAGAAQLARAASTIQNTAEMVSALETLSLFKACSRSASSDIDVKKLVPSTTSPGAFFVLEAVKGQRYDGDYTVEMLLSEISAAMMTADDYELILPQTEAAFHLYELLAMLGGAEMSPAALFLAYEGKESDAEAAKRLDWNRVEGMYGKDAMASELDDIDDAEEFDFEDEDFSWN